MQIKRLEELARVSIDCPKITEDKSSDNRVHTSDAKMIKTIDAVSRRGARGPRLSIIAVPNHKARRLRSTPSQCPNARVKTRVQHHLNG